MKRALIVFVLVLLFSSCIHIENAWHRIIAGSNSDEASERAFADITPEQEYVIGRAVAANILAA